eukprot:548942-Prymnesium_polylepis.1
MLEGEAALDGVEQREELLEDVAAHLRQVVAVDTARRKVRRRGVIDIDDEAAVDALDASLQSAKRTSVQQLGEGRVELGADQRGARVVLRVGPRLDVPLDAVAVVARQQ